MSQSTQVQDNSFLRIEGRLRSIFKAVHIGGIFITVIMMLLTVIHGVGRYFFDRPVPGLTELSSYMLITMVFLIGAYTMMEKRHVTIGLIVDRFSPRVQAILDSVTYVLCLLFAVLALWQSFVRAILLQQTTQQSGILHIPVFPFVYVVAVGWIILAVAIILHLVHFISAAVKK